MIATVGLAALFATAACGHDGGDGGEGLPPPTSPDHGQTRSTPAATLDPKDAEAWEEIQAKFDGFMETWIKWAAEGDPGGFEDPATAELNEYADAFLQGEISTELAQEAIDGRLRTGRPEWRDARLLRVDWNKKAQERVVPEAVFEVCVDDSEWIVVDAGTERPVAAEPGGPHVWTVTARWIEERDFGPKGWALIMREVDRGRSC